jgi:hypothetical protein
MDKTQKGHLINIEFNKLIVTIKTTINILDKLHKTKDIYISDLEKILRVIRNITEYLYNKYGEYKKVDKEVVDMVTTLYNPAIKEEGRLEGRLEGRHEGIFELLEENGSISDELRKKIQSETNPLILKKWLKLAAKASSIDEFTEKM